MWKQTHFIHRSGNLTDKHLDCVWIWSGYLAQTIVRPHAPVPRPRPLHPVHPPRPPRTPRRSFALSESVKFTWKAILDRWIGEKYGITRLSAKEASKLLIRRIQTISGYERHAWLPHTFTHFHF